MTNSRITRDTLLNDVRRVVVKVGSAVVTTGDGLNCDAINRLADQLAALVNLRLDVVLVSSGAVAAGRQRIFERTSTKSKNNRDMASRQAASAIGQGRLMHDYDEAFARHGKITAQMLLTRSGLKNRERFLNARNTMERLLEWGVIPIVNENDPVSTKELEFGDNDTLGAMCLGLIGADLFINLTSANGVYDQNPDAHPEAKPIPTIDNISALDIEAMCDGKTNVGTGGMYSKLRAARRAAQLGVPTLIVSGRGEFDILNVLKGGEGGTLILPEDRTVSSKKFWLAYHDNPSGAILVDKGAANALLAKGKSLLPIGVADVDGCFERGALIFIKTLEGDQLGVGLSNFSADELTRIKGKRTDELAAILGPLPHDEAVHRDNMLLDAAI
ncbi:MULTISPECIES: glutamate 5-kinase [unclassified Pseudodesulfovibrio]|uniref:glutamate 5-kinase n=1 Tax=unclassified Pseudodesulfovibrio TaxID=2661612 RepID=UPI000FEBE693|nr:MULTISPECIES: glutamate 5-kinase [unclassified Pseudodesulfovibrio]MCJ2163593.1 glutamate 5-kinase [Pseudodesulfovibrio sp. S3-i]RWU06827.1 glutamate 5-kinase [Pseudodesulfovibrio sp. S3]